MAKNPNINKYNRGLLSVRRLKPNEDPVCLPNAKTDYLKMSKKRRAKLDSQKRRFGFTDTETWDLDYTACVWLYSHIKMLLDIGGKVVNFEWEGGWSDEFRKELQDVGVDTKKYHNDKLVFEYICSLLEEADRLAVKNFDNESELKVLQLNKKAFMIFAVMLPTAWW